MFSQTLSGFYNAHTYHNMLKILERPPQEWHPMLKTPTMVTIAALTAKTETDVLVWSLMRQ
jgi:hypothetical protein